MATFDNVIVTNMLDVRGNTKLGNASVDVVTTTGTLQVGKNLTVAGLLDVNGNTTLGDSLSDTVTASGSMTVNNNLTVNGSTSADVIFANSVFTNQNVGVGADLTVSGTVNLGNDTSDVVNISGTLNVDTQLSVRGTTFLGDSTTSDVVVLVGQVTGSGGFVRVQSGQNLLFLGAGNGIVLKSPDGTVCSQLTIDNTGALVVTVLPACPV